jgi:hypothetical protein
VCVCVDGNQSNSCNDVNDNKSQYRGFSRMCGATEKDGKDLTQLGIHRREREGAPR